MTHSRLPSDMLSRTTIPFPPPSHKGQLLTFPPVAENGSFCSASTSSNVTDGQLLQKLIQPAADAGPASTLRHSSRSIHRPPPGLQTPVGIPACRHAHPVRTGNGRAGYPDDIRPFAPGINSSRPRLLTETFHFDRCPGKKPKASVKKQGLSILPLPLWERAGVRGNSLPQDSSLSHTFTLTLTLSHQGRGNFL